MYLKEVIKVSKSLKRILHQGAMRVLSQPTPITRSAQGSRMVQEHGDWNLVSERTRAW